ncbi:MAG: sulfatase-like hydrolase/transferase [Planctomycetota bacterium]|nr:sulfatase-like hydrolase/transferase [Planctomycetota bacterium]
MRLSLCTLCLFLSAPTLTANEAGKRKPNLVIIMADDLGYGELSCYGNKAYKTPHLDALAQAGMRFTDYHSNGAVCSPTRAALLTGRYQQRAGVGGVIYAGFDQNRNHGLHQSETTFAELLAGGGYKNGCFGKWHLGYEKKFNPVHHGFSRFRGYVSGNIDYQSHFDRVGAYDWWEGLEHIREKGYSTHLITRHAVKFIEEHRDRPFCLYVPHEAPHTPFQGPGDPGFRVKGKVVPEKRAAAFKKRAYREMVQEMDKGVGEIVAALERLGLKKNTVVFFVSDNGATSFGSNGSLRGNKGQLWEGGHRVPAIASWPGRIAAGSACDDLSIGMDIFPTLLELAGVNAPENLRLDGRSLVPSLFGKKPAGQRKLYWSAGRQQAMRDGPWKYVRELKGQKAAALYNLSSDQGEKNNLAGKDPARLASMRKDYAAWRKDVATGATKQPPIPGTKK